MLTTTNAERGQRNLGFLQLFNNASPISFPGREEKREVVPMVVEVEERNEQYSIVHVGVGASTDQKPPTPSSFRSATTSASTRAAATRTATGSDTAGCSTATSPYGTSLLRANSSFPGPALPGNAVPPRRRAELPAAGDRAARRRPFGRRLDRLFARDVPRRRRRHSLQPAQHDPHRAADPRRRARTRPRPAFAWEPPSAACRPTSSGCAWTTAWCRRAASASSRSPSWRCPALSAPLRPFPIDVGDDKFLKVSVQSLSVLPLGRWLSVRLGFRFEQGFPLGGASLLPKVERYFAGGDTTIRGFQLDRARLEVIRYLQFPIDPVTGVGLYCRRVPAAGRQPPHPAEHRPHLPDQPAVVRLRVLRQRRRRRFAGRADRVALPSRHRRVAAAHPPAHRRHQPGLGLAPSTPAPATPRSASSTSTSACCFDLPLEASLRDSFSGTPGRRVINSL